MGNVLDNDKRVEVVALGRVGWSLRRIQRATGVRRETVGEYLRAAGVFVRGRGRPGEGPAKAAISPEVSTDSAAAPVTAERSPPMPTRAPSASACEPYRDVITEALARGRNAMGIWQNLVDIYGCSARYASVRRFVTKLRATAPPEARVVITTAPGEDYGKTRVMLRAK